MKLEFGKYTDITNLAKKTNPELFEQYERVYVCPDTRNWWLSCILKGYNEDYERDEDSWLIERAMIEYQTERLTNACLVNPRYLRSILADWEGDCWDNCQTGSFEEAVEIVDGGFGINGEDEQ